jgi:hypothetical protein
MLNLGLAGTIHLAIEPVDGRKGIDGLAGVVRPPWATTRLAAICSSSATDAPPPATR